MTQPSHGEVERSSAQEDLTRAPVPDGEQVDVRHGMFGAKDTGDTSGYGHLVRRVTLPGASERPYGGWFDEVADHLERAMPSYADGVEKVVVDRGEITFHVRREHLVDVIRTMRDDPALRFEMCMGVSGVHFPHETGRELHPGNDWHERETFDFFGIVFDGHPGLTRIEMPDDWPGHPQRKDYPLGGIPVEYKGAQIPPPDERRSYS